MLFGPFEEPFTNTKILSPSASLAGVRIFGSRKKTSTGVLRTSGLETRAIKATVNSTIRSQQCRWA